MGQPIVARVTGTLDEARPGQQVALMFESADPAKPIVIGPITPPGTPAPGVITPGPGFEISTPAPQVAARTCEVPSPASASASGGGGEGSSPARPTVPVPRAVDAGLEQTVNVQVDDDQLTLTADRQITLRCGKASITLTAAGKVLIRGAYLLNRSSGVNKIKGGSVQIN